MIPSVIKRKASQQSKFNGFDAVESPLFHSTSINPYIQLDKKDGHTRTSAHRFCFIFLYIKKKN